MDDTLYFGLEDDRAEPDSTAPCDWSQELDQTVMVAYFYDWTSFNQVYLYMLKTLLFLPLMFCIDTSDTRGKPPSWATLEAARIKLFWSTPKVQRTSRRRNTIPAAAQLALLLRFLPLTTCVPPFCADFGR